MLTYKYTNLDKVLHKPKIFMYIIIFGYLGTRCGTDISVCLSAKK